MNVIIFRTAPATQAAPQKQSKFGMFRAHPNNQSPQGNPLPNFFGPSTDVFLQPAPRAGHPEVSNNPTFTQYTYPNRTSKVYKNNSNEEIEYSDKRKETRYTNDSNIRSRNPNTGVNTLYYAASGNILFEYPNKVKVNYDASSGNIEFKYNHELTALFHAPSGDLLLASPNGWTTHTAIAPQPRLGRSDTDVSDSRGVVQHLGIG